MNELRELNVGEIEAVAGGYDLDIPYCGTVPRWPFPRPIDLAIDPRINPGLIVIGSRGG